MNEDLAARRAVVTEEAVESEAFEETVAVETPTEE